MGTEERQGRGHIIEWGAIALLGAAMWGVSISAHELLGHGGVCAVDPNCTWIYADAMYFDGELGTGAWEAAWRAAGSLVNIVIGCLAGLALFLRTPRARWMRIALWQLVSINFIQSGSYIAFGWLIDPGMDWAQFVAASADPDQARILVLIGGGVLIDIGLVAASLALPLFLGASSLRARAGIVLPSMAGFSGMALAASAFVPTDERVYMLLGGFGSGTLFMLWLFLAVVPLPGLRLREQASARPIPLLVVILSAVLALTYALYLGRGIHFT